MSCNLCPRACAGVPFCKKGGEIRIASAFLHRWEEPCISGENGCGTVFFSGCNLACVYCQNHKISHLNFGRDISALELRKIFEDLVSKGAECISLVTATHYIDKILPALKEKLPIPIVYNCSGFESVDTLRSLEGYIDVYMPDMKYAFSSLSRALSSAASYPEINLAAIEEMYRQVGDCEYNERGILKKGVLVRHLMLPGEALNTKAVIKRFADISKGRKMLFSLMAQYTPMQSTDFEKFPKLARKITASEYRSAVSYLARFPQIEGFVQDLESASSEYIPDFCDGDFK